MYSFPDTEKKLKSKISSYKSALNKEKKNYGYVNDGSGKRYLLFCLYFVLNDMKKAQAYLEWYQEEFTDDAGEPIQKLCWALMLHRMEKTDEAEYMLAETMLSNLYMIPDLIGQNVQKYDIWHSSNLCEPDYIEYVPEEVKAEIKESEIEWLRSLYDSLEFRRIKKRYIEIFHALESSNSFEERGILLAESYALTKSLQP
jgi:hypothetical protein